MPLLPGGYHFDYRLLAAAKALLALGALLLLLWDLYVGRTASATWIRFRTRALIALGVLAIAAWWNFGALHGPGRPLHLHDFFHYYVGSKYFPELGYARFYRCVAVAEVELGLEREVARRWTRNLESNELERGAPTAAEAHDCRERFSSTRWAAFTRDITWFRDRMQPAQWTGVHMVYGHNATPVWNAMGYWLTNTGAASDVQILLLAALEPVLVLLVWIVVCRTFGWPAAAIAAVWWGFNEASGYYWIGGSFLRHDALALVVCGVCALRLRRPLLGGAALAGAALLRAFPVVLLVALAMKVVHVAWRGGLKTARREYRRLAMGVVLASGILLAGTAVTWSATGAGVLEPWRAFLVNSRKHLDTPVNNHMGLKTVLAFSSENRTANLFGFWLDAPWDTWMAARRATFKERQPLYYAIFALFLVWFALSVPRLEDWIVVILGVTLLPFAANLANYYYSVLLVLALLWPRDRYIGTGLVALTVLTAGLPAVLDERDDRYMVVSAALVVFAFFAVTRARRLRQAAAPAVPAGAGVRATDPRPV